jgi:hypothetical protein
MICCTNPCRSKPLSVTFKHLNVVVKELLVFIKFARSFQNKEKIVKIKSYSRREVFSKKRLKIKREKLQR